jgi:hypothetical protein
MPGVRVTTAVRTGPTGVTIAPASTFFIVGTAERGPVDEAVLVESLADFEAYYGDFNSSYSLHQQIETFFEEGGTRAYVSRAVGASTSVGTITLNASGAVPALTLDAANPGAWSADLDVVVEASGSGFLVKLLYDGSLKYTTGEVANVSEAVNKINASPVASAYVEATAVSGSSVLVAATATPLSTGDNGDAPLAADYVTALELFGPELGAGAVAAPGQFGSTIYNGLLEHAGANNRIAIFGFDPSYDEDDAIAEVAGYAAVEFASAASFYYPHVTIPGAGQTTLTLSPEGYVAAKRSIAHNRIGPWQPGAGVLSQARFVTGTSATVNKSVGDALDEGRVNAIRVIQGTVRIYGARSASNDEVNYRYITQQDTLNHIVVEAERTLEDLVFSAIDGRRTVFGRTEARLIAILEPMRAAGGLYEAFDVNGNQIDPGYSVEVTDALNPVAQLQDGLIRAKVGVRISSVGDRIEVEVVKSNLTSSVV